VAPLELLPAEAVAAPDAELGLDTVGGPPDSTATAPEAELVVDAAVAAERATEDVAPAGRSPVGGPAAARPQAMRRVHTPSSMPARTPMGLTLAALAWSALRER
jgi:hypothetical protein